MKGVLAGALAVAGLTFAVAYPSLRYDFVYDDVAVVLERRPFQELGPDAFLESTPWVTGRHMTAVSLDLDRSVPDPSGRPLPLPFHRTNLVLAALLSVLVLALALRLGLSPLAATVAAAVFAVHPTHVDAVVSIVGRAELLAANGVIAVLLTCVGRQSAEGTNATGLGQPAPVRSAAGRGWVALGCTVFAVLAVHSKESALCVPLLIVLARLLLGPRVAWVPALAGTAVALASWALVTGATTAAVDSTQFVDNPLVYAPAMERIPKALAILWQYATLLLWPHPLLPDRSWATTDPGMAAGWAATAAWIVAAVALWGLRHRAPRAVFALAWFAAAFAITGNVAKPIGTLMAERLLLLPSVSVCLLAGLGVDALAKSVAARRAAVGVAVVIVALLFVSFRSRAAVWENEAVYFPAAAAASPQSAKAQFEHGNWLLRSGKRVEAEAAYARALAIVPSFSRAASLRAESMAKRGDAGGAAEAYIEYLEVRPDDADAVTNVTRLMLWADRPEEAVSWAQKLVAMRPGDQKSLDALVIAETALKRAKAAAGSAEKRPAPSVPGAVAPTLPPAGATPSPTAPAPPVNP